MASRQCKVWKPDQGRWCVIDASGALYDAAKRPGMMMGSMQSTGLVSSAQMQDVWKAIAVFEESPNAAPRAIVVTIDE